MRSGRDLAIGSLVGVAAMAVAGRAEAGIVTFSSEATFLAATGATSATGALPNAGLIPGGAAGSITVGSVTFTIAAPSSNFAITDITSRYAGNEISISDVENLNAQLASARFSMGFRFVEPQFDPQVNGPF